MALSGTAAAVADVAPIRTISSMQLRRKRFDRPDEIRTVEKARIELVELGELAVGRAIFARHSYRPRPYRSRRDPRL